MTTINTEVAEQPDEIKAGQTYRIQSADEVKTALQGFKGIRVIAEEIPSGNIFGTMLWLRDIVGTKSKLGTFVEVLGNDTDKWIGQIIDVLIWEDKSRQIKVHAKGKK